MNYHEQINAALDGAPLCPPIQERTPIDIFFAHVQTHGFQGYSPGKADILGDAWASKIGKVFDEVANAKELTGERRHRVWLVFQWLYCELAGMRCRIIASPPACRAAGMEINDATVQLACDMLIESQEY